jgi:hypothetical protein
MIKDVIYGVKLQRGLFGNHHSIHSFFPPPSESVDSHRESFDKKALKITKKASKKSN